MQLQILILYNICSVKSTGNRNSNVPGRKDEVVFLFIIILDKGGFLQYFQVFLKRNSHTSKDGYFIIEIFEDFMGMI